MLPWYGRQHRKLPWRAAPGQRADPYRVWLSEIMLQQTGVKTVIPYYQYFLKQWPTVAALARADLDQVLHAWQGLGYYARARNLHKCAQVVANDFGGEFPNREAGLRHLPGIGPYTAAAVVAIAFGHKASPVDGNIERVVSRLFAVREPLPGVKPKLRELAASLTPARRAGDHAQALMDLGATICLPRAPLCDRCPLAKTCEGRAQGIAADLPQRAKKAVRPTKYGVAFCLFDHKGRLLFRRRPEKGLLGGMMEVPSTPWTENQWRPDDVARHAPVQTEWRGVPGTIVHVFTHFRLELQVQSGTGAYKTKNGDVWQKIDELGDLALPTVMKKILRQVLPSV